MSSISIVAKNKTLEALYGPVWWYTRGYRLVFAWIVEKINEYRFRIGVGIWIKNIFVPMYGQNDIAGKAISVFMRGVQIIARSITLAAVSLAFLLCAALWGAIPLIIAYHLLSF